MKPALRTFLRYGGALGLAALALGFRLGLQPFLGLHHHYAALLAAVVVAAAIFGLGPAILVTVLGSLGLDGVVRGHVIPQNRDDLVGLLLFMGEGVLISCVIELQRRVQAQLRHNESLSSELLTEYEKELAERKRARAAERRHALWLEVTLSSIADGLVVTNEEGVVTYINAAGEKITRVTAEASRGKAADGLFRLIDEDSGATQPSPVDEALGRVSAVVRPEKTALVAPDGARIPVIVSSALMREESGGVTGVVLVFHDMTRVREIEARRADSEGRFRALTDVVPALIWMSRADGSWEYFNSAWKEMTGRSPEQESGYQWINGLHPDDRAAFQAVYQKALEDRSSFQIEHRLLDSAGEYRWVVNRGAPRYGAGGRFLGFVGSCVDVTRHKEAEEASRLSEDRFRRMNAELDRFSAELAQANVELQQQNRAIQRAIDQKTRFLATMSHELRTPMNAVIGFVDLLAEESAGPLTPKQKRFLGHIHRAGDHLLRLVENILDYSRIEAGRFQLDCHEFEARPIVQEVVAGITQIDREKAVRVVVDVPSDFRVYADRQRFRQILYNLTSNAMKFTPKGGRVVISAWRDENLAYLSVQDTGVGIAPDQLGPVFQEFHQARSPERNKGTGLGL
ncbi:MAG TPA: PAS domain S-box protein, partial [Terriglobia bacterium]|nr:PAS domain S-box protein [Terriglobia bacterium]